MKKLYVLVFILFAMACADDTSNPVSNFEQAMTNSITVARKGSNAGEFIVNATATDFSCTKAPLVSTCSGSTAYQGLQAAFFNNCLAVTPTGSSYSLTDEPVIYPKQSKNSQQILTVQYYAQDIEGPNGIQHRTDAIPVSVPVAPNSSGFVIHVHADNIPVWKLSGHTTGKKVEVIGKICVGDLVYTPAN